MGCQNDPREAEKIRDIDFTVVNEMDLPDQLRQVIEGKKEHGFKLTYAEGDYLYIVIGYGAQKTGGYSIVVNDLYLTENAIFFDTELFGPRVGDVVDEAVSYPYIAVKIEYIDRSVVFD
jgi:hypothetical protein